MLSYFKRSKTLFHDFAEIQKEKRESAGENYGWARQSKEQLNAGQVSGNLTPDINGMKIHCDTMFGFEAFSRKWVMS